MAEENKNPGGNQGGGQTKTTETHVDQKTKTTPPQNPGGGSGQK